ncbi:unnamed protein product [Microthlaspi erraticum]|uniref:Uncharacterized protein n=1 Tax=Microthlaspi erraticum TaxID=1685480 RepID=A0A6D2IUK2_9BRAS|nr:unnamed protein product [Microthlaspi erraticum]
MTGHKGDRDSKKKREIFLTSSSLSFSSLSSSCASSWDETVERNTKSSSEEQKGKLSKASSRGSQKSDVTHVTMQPPPSPPPSRSPAIKLTNNGLENHDPERIPATVFGKNGDVNWSEISNESLFSLAVSSYQAFRQSNVKPKEALTPPGGEYLSYSPSELVKPDKDGEEKRSETKETKSGVTSVGTSGHGEKSSYSPPPAASWSTSPSNFYELYQSPPTKAQSLSDTGGYKKKSKTRKSKKKKKKNKKKEKKEKKEKEKEKEKEKKFNLFQCLTNKCCIWSWLCSGIPKCECFKWRKCCCCCCCCWRRPKAKGL